MIGAPGHDHRLFEVFRVLKHMTEGLDMLRTVPCANINQSEEHHDQPFSHVVQFSEHFEEVVVMSRGTDHVIKE